MPAPRGRKRKIEPEASVEVETAPPEVEVEEEEESAPEAPQAPEKPPVITAVALQRFRLWLGDRNYDVHPGQVFVVDPRDVIELTDRCPPLAACK